MITKRDILIAVVVLVIGFAIVHAINSGNSDSSSALGGSADSGQTTTQQYDYQYQYQYQVPDSGSGNSGCATDVGQC